MFPEENQQAYRIGAQGLLPTSNRAMACMHDQHRHGRERLGECRAARLQQHRPLAGERAAVRHVLAVRRGPVGALPGITDIDTLATAYLPDTDVTDLDDYTAYTGNGQRVITVPVVDALNRGAT